MNIINISKQSDYHQNDDIKKLQELYQQILQIYRYNLENIDTFMNNMGGYIQYETKPNIINESDVVNELFMDFYNLGLKMVNLEMSKWERFIVPIRDDIDFNRCRQLVSTEAKQILDNYGGVIVRCMLVPNLHIEIGCIENLDQHKVVPDYKGISVRLYQTTMEGVDAGCRDSLNTKMENYYIKPVQTKTKLVDVNISPNERKILNKTYTITFGDVAENHVNMQKIGILADNGFSIDQLDKLKQKLEIEGLETQIVRLDSYWTGVESKNIEAAVLIIRKGVQYILNSDDTKKLMAEHDALAMDKHALMRGRVVNKLARWNLCFADQDQEPNYESGKGRIVSYTHIPLTNQIREKLPKWLENANNLNGEANYYYDITKCGIGYHGDSERKKVIAVRMGDSMPLYYQWYQNSNPIGDRIKIDLHDGDMYIMSEKAVGTDWKKRLIPTLRHATGCDKYTKK